MISSRTRPLWIALAILVVAWAVAVAGFQITKHSQMTAEKVRAYAQSVDFARLTGSARAEAIRKLAAKLNALPPEERRRARMERIASGWFENMTEEEKGEFIEATMPTGFKQMLVSFEQLPEEKRRRAIDDAMKRLKEAAEKPPENGDPSLEGQTNQPPALSQELQEKITRIGLKSFYSESSAQTKAEMAPMMEELQRMMESGVLFRNRR